MKLRFFSLLVCVVLISMFLFTHKAESATFCVSSASELQTALTTAASNGEDDEVQIVQGIYVGNFIFATPEVNNLTIEGGYTSNCSTRELEPTNTILDGNQLGTVLAISSLKEIDFTLDGVTLQNGLSPADKNGGGIFIDLKGGDITITNNIIDSNSADRDGGGIYAYGSTVSITNNTISYNHGGGGVSAHASSGTVTLTNNTISYNRGHGVFASGEGTIISITNNTISYNDSYNGGGVFASGRGTIISITNNTISYNDASHSGGGVYAFVYEDGGIINFTNNNIFNNSANEGGGIIVGLNDDSTISNIYNNIIYDNSAAVGNNIYIENDGNANYFPSEVNLFNNNFDQSEDGTYIVIPFTIDLSNLDNIDPLFVDAINGDYHLQPDSPCIDKGHDNAPELPTTDKGGNSRILNGTVDMGAYEYSDSLTFHSLTVTKGGNGIGMVTSHPSGIDCGTFFAPSEDCKENYYNEGVTVKLTAVAKSSSTFAGWTNCDNSVGNECAVTMDADKTVTAIFNSSNQTQQHTLEVIKSGTGTGTVNSDPSGIDCGDDCTEDYDEYTEVTLTATEDSNSVFIGWSGCVKESGNMCVFKMDADKTVTAIFNLSNPTQQHTLAIVKSGNGTGTVTSDSAGIDCGDDCEEDYNHETSITLIATPNAGSVFSGWSGGGCSGTDTCKVTMDEAKTVTATFSPISSTTYTLTVAKDGFGSGTVTSDPTGIDCGDNCAKDYAEGTVITLTVTADAGSVFSGWSGCDSSTDNTCVVSMDSNETVTATFNLSSSTSYSLTVTKDGSGSGTIKSNPTGIDCGDDCTEDYAEGTVVMLTATGDSNSVFISWLGCDLSNDNTCVVSINSDKEVTATFNLSSSNSYALAVTKEGSGSGIVTSSSEGIDCGDDCENQYNEGTEVTLIATADAGFAFTGWSGGGCSGTNDCVVTINEDTTVTAMFNKSMSATLRKAIIIDKKNPSNKDKVSLILTGCNSLKTAVANLDTSSVHISLGPDGESAFYDKPILGGLFTPNLSKTEYKCKVNYPERHRDLLLPEKGEIKLKISKTELDEILNPKTITSIRVAVTIGEYTYESIANCEIKVDKPNKTKYICR